MQIIQYQTEEEAQTIIQQKTSEGLTLVAISNVTEGNFLGFSDAPVPGPTPTETRVAKLEKDFYTPSTPVGAYNAIDLNTISLADLKTAKIAQLNYLCTQTILSPFVSSALSTPHTYSFDYQAQIRFGGKLAKINDPTFTDTSVNWNTKENGFVPHTIPQFRQVFADGEAWTTINMSKYFTLKGQVLAITDPTKKSDVTAINW